MGRTDRNILEVVPAIAARRSLPVMVGARGAVPGHELSEQPAPERREARLVGRRPG